MTKHQLFWVAIAVTATIIVLALLSHTTADTSADRDGCLTMYVNRRSTCNATHDACSQMNSASCTRNANECNYSAFVRWSNCVQVSGGTIPREHLEIARHAYEEALWE